MRNTFILLLLGALAACSSRPYPVSSPYYTIPAGSKLVLKQALTIPANTGRVYIQYGKVVSPKLKDDFYANCWFLSWNVRDTAQVIEPDSFLITRSDQLEGIVSRTPDWQFAMRDVSYVLNHSNDGGPMALVYSTEMYIHSDKQPDIRRFVCSHWEDPIGARHLTVAEMQKALGDIAEIQLNRGN